MLLVDASATPATTTLTVQNVGTPGDGVSQVTGDGGVEATTFSGFSALTVRGGDGPFETITLASANPADPDGAGPGAALTAITLDGDNITSTDMSNDFLLVQSLPASISTNLFGGQGSDVFQLNSGGLFGGGSLDFILGPVNVFGEDHNLLAFVSSLVCGVTKTLPLGDRLRIIDVGSGHDNAYTLSPTTFQRTGLSATGLVTHATVERFTDKPPW